MVAPELHQKGRFPQGHLFEKIPTKFVFFSLWGNFQKSHFFGDLKAMLKWDRHLNMYVPRTFLLGTYLLMCSWLDPLRYYWQTEISGPQAKLFFQGLLAFFSLVVFKSSSKFYLLEWHNELKRREKSILAGKCNVHCLPQHF